MIRPKLFMLHFAGGNSYSYRFLSKYLMNFEVIPLELPGRGKKMNDALLNNFHMASLYICNLIQEQVISEPFLLFGHSMGAALLLRVCLLLEAKGISPSYLFVSGHPGPGISLNKKRYLLNDEDFLIALKALGGIPTELLNDEDSMAFYMPIIRADFQIAEENDLNENDKITTPIFATMGESEESADQILNWANYTTGRFDYRLFRGKHFFIYDHPREIASIITATYDYHKIL